MDIYIDQEGTKIPVKVTRVRDGTYDWESLDGLTGGTHSTAALFNLKGEEVKPEVKEPPEKSFERQLAAIREQLEEAKQQAARTEENIFTAIRKGLTSPPVPGEPWDPEKRYIAGDTSTAGGVEYTSLRFNKGKDPQTEPLYWEPKVKDPEPSDFIVWAEIPSQTLIKAGTLVTHNDRGWRCTEDHKKALVRQPSDFNTNWWEGLSNILIEEGGVTREDH